jgi:hypothetical protein
MSLPLAQRKAAALSLLTFGVISGPKGFLSCIVSMVTGKLERQSGFVVEVRSAIELLEASHPEAAAWWRTHAPHLLRGRKYFLFHEAVGHVVEAQSDA